MSREMSALRVTVVGALAIVLVAAPLGARAEQDVDGVPSPVRIDACVVRFDWHGQDRTAAGLEIDFTDVAPVAATHILFRAGYNGRYATIRQSGSFAPGVETRKTYRDVFAGGPWIGPAAAPCRVLGVALADGAVWTLTSGRGKP